ncbi:MAG: glycosyltransferase family 2 protein, partial [Ignavibacteriae bacterium]|nr:glycosyltransferase family 2 protein [Ignavibacteriota bacterium]
MNSVYRQTYGNIEVLVVDNNSSDNSLDLIKSQFKDVKIINTGYNAGWGVGCNIGIEESKGELISVINNDAFLDNACIEEMVKAILLKNDYGSCACKILLSDENEKIEVVGLSIYKDGMAISRGRHENKTEYSKSEEVFCASDCVCLYRREMLNEIGLYDPDFFMYANDSDIGWRQQLYGWKCIYNPMALAYHAHSKSAGNYSDFKAFYVERNRLYVAFKYFPLFDFILSFYYSLYRYILQLSLIKRNKGSLAKYKEESSLIRGLGILIKAHFSFFKALPSLYKKRIYYFNRCKITSSMIKYIFKVYG